MFRERKGACTRWGLVCLRNVRACLVVSHTTQIMPQDGNCRRARTIADDDDEWARPCRKRQSDISTRNFGEKAGVWPVGLHLCRQIRA